MSPMMWLIVLIAMVAIEAVTYGLTTIWFGAGALAAGIASYLGADRWIQLLSLVLLFVTRPLAIKYMKKGMPKTNVNSLVGKKAIVTETIDNLAQTGRVKLHDVEWMADTKEDGCIIPEGSVVEILEVKGAHLIVT